MRRLVLTGAPGTGKTSVVALLRDWFPTVAEPARELIAEHAAATGENTLDGRPELFVERLVARSIRDFYSAAGTGVVIHDRGLPDCVAYAAALGIDPGPVLEQAAAFRYQSPIFIAPPWRAIYTTDNLRRASFEQVEAFDVHLRWAYTRLGYEMIVLPRASPQARADFIVEHIEQTRIDPS